MTKNNIKSKEHGVEVTLDPEWILGHVLYLPDGKTMVKSNMTLGQAIIAIALANVNVKAPQPKEKFSAATVTFKDGKFLVQFAVDTDHLCF